MKKILLLAAMAVLAFEAGAQKVGLKNNLLYDATLTPNLGIEIGLGRKTTLDITGGYNPFEFCNDKMWKHWIVQPEFRWYTWTRFHRHFFGLHALGGEYNFQNVTLPFGLVPELKNHRYEGYFYGGGISYGYQWVLSCRWSLEATIGVGYANIYYEKYNCWECSDLLESGHTNYFGPTKLGVNLILLFN